MKTKALYAGTFDPITHGHYWIISEASKLFEEVVVAVADNPEKRNRTMFSIEDRVKMVQESVQGLEGVTVVRSTDGIAPLFTARFAHSIGATHLVRGIRNESDFGAEQAIRHVNEDICPSVKTMFLVPPRDLSEVSSSMVKSLMDFDGWRDVIGKYVHPCVLKRFQANRLGIIDIMLRLGASKEAAVEAKSFLDNMYGDGKAAGTVRTYHNINHILECLDLLRLTVSDSKISPLDFDQMAAAIWFHDCVYDPAASDNEEKSSSEFANFSTGIQDRFVWVIRLMIEATKHHGFSTRHKVNVVNDIDMAILGASRQKFDNYDERIRHEYRQVPDDVFYPARKKLLQQWLSSKVYHTEMFSTLFEEAKNSNIEWALKARCSYNR